MSELYIVRDDYINKGKKIIILKPSGKKEFPTVLERNLTPEEAYKKIRLLNLKTKSDV
jgi:hypothetical protein